MKTVESGVQGGESGFDRMFLERAQAQVDEEIERSEELQGKQAPGTRRVPVPVMVVGVVTLGFLALAMISGGSSDATSGYVATLQGAGVGSTQSAYMVPASPSPAQTVVVEGLPSASPSPSPSPSAAPTAKPEARRGGTSRREDERRRARADMQRREKALDEGLIVLGPEDAVIVDARAGLSGPAESAAKKVRPVVVNIGARLPCVLEMLVRTGASVAPASALLLEDVRQGEQLVLPKGSRLVGQAIATEGDDRAQIVWQAVVVDGRTLPLSGYALGPDGVPGLQGKVKKKRRSILGRVSSLGLRTAGAIGVGGVLGVRGVEGLALSQVGQELSSAGSRASALEWLRTDKEIEVKPGVSLLAYVSDDLVVGEH